MISILAATATFFYTVTTANTQGCYQKVGNPNPVCQVLTTGATPMTGLEDDTEYDFWAIVDGVASTKSRIRTQKKTQSVTPPPGVVITP